MILRFRADIPETRGLDVKNKNALIALQRQKRNCSNDSKRPAQPKQPTENPYGNLKTAALFKPKNVPESIFLDGLCRCPGALRPGLIGMITV